MATEHPKCHWCLKRRKPSRWEQQDTRSGEYHRLCGSCAARRLSNPWNALLSMRKIESSPTGETLLMGDVVDVLDESCRTSVWQYTDPVWPRYYAWFPDDGCAAWWHSGDGGWFASVACANDVDSSVITGGMSPRGTHEFRRVGANPAMSTA